MSLYCLQMHHDTIVYICLNLNFIFLVYFSIRVHQKFINTYKNK
jgi:hypothetical protein